MYIERLGVVPSFALWKWDSGPKSHCRTPNMAQMKKKKISKGMKQDHRSTSATTNPDHCTSFNIYLPSERIIRMGVLFSVLGIIIFSVGSYYVQTIHDNERSFSDLSDLEREISFRSEMGFYYYFYKSFISAKTFSNGIRKLMRDPFIEYPDVVNALRRFTIWPEFLIGILYRALNSYGLLSYECFSFKRDDGYTYESCVGLGEPIFFYLQFVWYSAGFTALFIFFFGLFLSKSPFGGLLSLLLFFYNHAECSRVQWSPPLRETFAYPLLLFEMLVVSISIDKNSNINHFRWALLRNDGEEQSSQITKPKKSSLKESFGTFLQVLILSNATTLALMFWQFSQFVLFTQSIIITFLYIGKELPEEFMFVFTFTQWMGICMACFFLQFNQMLISSIYASWTMATFLIFLTFRAAKLPQTAKQIMSIIMIPLGSIALRQSIYSGEGDDSHIFSLLKSKLTNFENFHTLIYTCSAEYNFLPLSVLINLSYTGLLPLVIFILASVFYYWTKTTTQNKIFGDVDTPIIYNIMQSGVFCVMAVLFMRLKLFSNPHLCILASLFTSKYMPNFIRRWNIIWVLVLVLLMSYQGIQNIKDERTTTGTFTYHPLEDLLKYIKINTPPESVYAGPMTTTAAILVTMQRSVVLHPHYEHTTVRKRTRDVYAIFSRKSEAEVYEKLTALQADYVIIDYMWCYSKSKMGCFLTDNWDKEDVKNRKNPSFCSVVYENSTSLKNFEEIYQNDAFSLLKVKKKQFF